MYNCFEREIGGGGNVSPSYKATSFMKEGHCIANRRTRKKKSRLSLTQMKKKKRGSIHLQLHRKKNNGVSKFLQGGGDPILSPYEGRKKKRGGVSPIGLGQKMNRDFRRW